MSAVLKQLPEKRRRAVSETASEPTLSPESHEVLAQNRAWEIVLTLLQESSVRKAWAVAAVGALIGVLGIGAVFVQGPLRRVEVVTVIVDKYTGETTVKRQGEEDAVPVLESVDKGNLETFVMARERYMFRFLQQDYNQVRRRSTQEVFAPYDKLFQGGKEALDKKLADSEEWDIKVVQVRLSPEGRTGPKKNRGAATVVYDKTVRSTTNKFPPETRRYVASVIFEYHPGGKRTEEDHNANPFNFMVVAYRADPELNTPVAPSPTQGSQP